MAEENKADSLSYYRKQQLKKKGLLVMSSDGQRLINAQQVYDKSMFTNDVPEEEIIVAGTEYYQAGLAYMQSLKNGDIPDSMKEAVKAWQDYCAVTNNNQIPTLPLSPTKVDRGVLGDREKMKKKLAEHRKRLYEKPTDILQK